MWLELVFKLPIFNYLFLFQVRKQSYFFPTWNLKNFISEISWYLQLLWFLNLKQANPLCRLCSALLWLDWLKILCRRQSCGLKDNLMLSLKALSSSAWPRKYGHLLSGRIAEYSSCSYHISAWSQCRLLK